MFYPVLIGPEAHAYTVQVCIFMYCITHGIFDYKSTSYYIVVENPEYSVCYSALFVPQFKQGYVALKLNR